MLVDNEKLTFDDLSPRVVLTYKPWEDGLLYGSYSRAIKSGTFNVVALSPTPVRPETLTAYEIGFKSRFGPVTWNSAAYHYDYEDLQVQIFTAPAGGGPGGTVALVNAATATMNGLETDLRFNVSDSLSVDFGAAFLKAEYDSFPEALVTMPTGLGGNTQFQQDVTGYDVIRAPGITFNANVNYRHALSDGSAITFTPSVFFSGDYYWDPLNRIRQPSYALVTARVTWTSADERLSASIFGRNLMDARNNAIMGTSTLGDFVVRGEPRVFGITLGYSY